MGGADELNDEDMLEGVIDLLNRLGISGAYWCETLRGGVSRIEVADPDA